MGTKNQKINIFNEIDLEEEIDKALANEESIEEYKKIIRISLGEWLKNLKSGVIKLNTVGDLKTLIEADLMLRRDDE